MKKARGGVLTVISYAGRIQALALAALTCFGLQAAAGHDQQAQPSIYERVMARLFPLPDAPDTSYTLRYLFGPSEMQIAFSDAPSGVQYAVTIWRLRKGQQSVAEQLDRAPLKGRSVEEAAAALAPFIEKTERLVHRSSDQGMRLRRIQTLAIPSIGSEQIVLHGTWYSLVVQSPGKELSLSEWGNTESPKDNSALVNWMIAVRAAFEDLKTTGIRPLPHPL